MAGIVRNKPFASHGMHCVLPHLYEPFLAFSPCLEQIKFAFSTLEYFKPLTLWLLEAVIDAAFKCLDKNRDTFRCYKYADKDSYDFLVVGHSASFLLEEVCDG
jgi:hypothetical protein